MVKNKNTATEQSILQAAKNIFLRKGMTGTRMQEIANEAGINKALLHYYFRSKQLLFEAVFMQAFKLMAPKLNTILNSPISLEKKIRDFSNNYISFVIKHPYLPNFIMQELNNNPDFVDKLSSKEYFPHLDYFKDQVQSAVKNGEIIDIKTEQLFINLIALSVFPFIGKPLLKGITQMDENSYVQLMENRKKEVGDFIINAIKIKK